MVATGGIVRHQHAAPSPRIHRIATAATAAADASPPSDVTQGLKKPRLWRSDRGYPVAGSPPA